MTPLCPTLCIYRVDIVCQNLQLGVFDNPDGTFNMRNFALVFDWNKTIEQVRVTAAQYSQDFQRDWNMTVKTRRLSVLLLHWKLSVFASIFSSIRANLSSSLKSYISINFDVETVDVKHSPALSVAVMSLARLPGKVTDRRRIQVPTFGPDIKPHTLKPFFVFWLVVDRRWRRHKVR